MSRVRSGQVKTSQLFAGRQGAAPIRRELTREVRPDPRTALGIGSPLADGKAKWFGAARHFDLRVTLDYAEVNNSHSRV